MKPIDWMYQLFGKTEQFKCKDCDHLASYEANRKYYKCVVWGSSCCAESDWRLKWQACGMFNKPYTGKEIRLLRLREAAVDEPIDGQESFL